MSEDHRRRASSADSIASAPPRSPSPPTQIYHPSIIPRPVPTPALVESVAGAAHYSGVRIDPDAQLKHRQSSHSKNDNHTELKDEHRTVMDDLQELYCCRPTLELVERLWHKDAIFEDPLAKCKGFSEYAAQWFSMPKLFSKSERTSSRVMSSTHTPNRLVFSQTQVYTFRLFQKSKTVESVLIVDLNDDGKIIRLVDRWNGRELPTWFGATFLRVLHAKVLPWLVYIPKH